MYKRQEYDFYQREDGYDALCRTYGLQFKSTADMDIGLKYQAIQQQQIDVMPIFTTDGQLSVSDLVVLEDDLHFYPSYLCGNVVRLATLEEYPELEPVLTMLEGKISDQVMADLNYQVEEMCIRDSFITHKQIQTVCRTVGPLTAPDVVPPMC